MTFLSVCLPVVAETSGEIQTLSFEPADPAQLISDESVARQRQLESRTDFPSLLLIFSVLLAIAFSAVIILWRKNSILFFEIKVRSKAQKQLRLLNKEILKKAYTDELSGMGNRRAFFEKAEVKLKLAKLDQAPLAVLMLDIDHFKNINDQYGHAQGDKFIQAFAKVVLKTVREGDVQGRIGGEEFALMAVNTSLDGAIEIAERIRLYTESIELIHDDQTIKTSISIGISVFEPDSDDLASLMRRAYDALYEAKELGRNRVIITT